jgi:hypothetical protein
MSIIKQNIANLITDAHAAQSKNEQYKQLGADIHKLRESRENIIDLAETTNNELKDFSVQQTRIFNNMIRIQTMTLGNLPDSERLKKSNESNVEEYLELVAKENKIDKKPFHDVVFALNSKSTNGSETLKTVIDYMNKKGANIEVVYEKNREKASNNDNFLLIMPSTSYAQFNEMINKDQLDSKNDINGERKSYFYLNALNENFSIDDIKKELKSEISKNGNPMHLFSEKFGLVYTPINSSNINAEENITNAVHNVFSQIKNMEPIKDTIIITDKIIFSPEKPTPFKEAQKNQNNLVVKKMEKQEEYIRKTAVSPKNK